MNEIEELPIPSSVLSAEHKTEMARIWLADNNQVVALSSRLWDDPGAWGIMLVNIANHVANAYASKGFDRNEAIGRIKAAMDAEWAAPTD